LSGEGSLGHVYRVWPREIIDPFFVGFSYKGFSG